MAETNALWLPVILSKAKNLLILQSYTVTKDIQRCFTPLNMTDSLIPVPAQ